MSDSVANLKECMFRYDNGQRRMHAFSSNDKLEGKCELWHRNGYPMEHSFYLNGLASGEYKMWNSSGRLIMHNFYSKGRLLVFSFANKRTFLRDVRNFRKRATVLLNITLISDLVKII